MENTIESAKDFLTKYRDERTHPVSVDYFAEMMTAYAASVRPEVVVPSEKIYNDYIDDFLECAVKNGFNECLSELRRLNPTLTFTELNHTAPTGDKSDEG